MSSSSSLSSTTTKQLFTTSGFGKFERIIYIEIGWETEVEIDSWDNEEFFRFLRDLELNRSSKFTYVIDHLFPIYDYGELYDVKTVEVDSNLMKNLQDLYVSINEFKKFFL